MRIVVFGWGNESRGDDGLGPLLLRRIAGMSPPGVETIEEYQLQIEHALDLEGFDAALFVDASRDAPTAFVFREIAARQGRTSTTHALSPEAVLEVFVRLTARAPPPAFVLGVHGERFELGEGLSPAGEKALAAAGAFCEVLMGSRTLADWRRLAAAEEPSGWTSSAILSGA